MNTEQTQHDNYVEQEGITLKEIFTILWVNKWLLIIITGIGLILGIVAGVIVNSVTSKVSTYVEFQWDGISKGEWPDSQRFDYGNMFESYVFNESLSNVGLDEISSSELRNSITVTPVIPNDTLALMAAGLEKGIQITYYASQYKITLDNAALNITVDQGVSLVNSILDNFRIDFERKYVQRAVILDYTTSDLADFDYIEAYDILASQIALINSAMDKVMPGADTFVSSELGIGFGEIQIRTNLVSTIELSTMSARINNYLLSKDKDLLITKYVYQVETLQLLLDKETEVEAGLNDLIDNYSGSYATIVIPGLDTTSLETDPYLNTLYASLVASQRTIATTTQDISYYETKIERLQGLDPTFIVTPEKEAEEIVKVEASIDRSSQTLSDIVSDLDILLTEYNSYITRSLVKPLMAPQYEPQSSLLLLAAIGLVVGGGIGTVAVFMKHYNFIERLKNKKTV